MTLNELKVGEKGIVSKISKESLMKQRFIDIGIIKGTKIECVLISPRKRSKSVYDKRCCYCNSKWRCKIYLYREGGVMENKIKIALAR